MKKNVLCLGLLMTGALACFQTEAQTITAPSGTPLTITNAIDVTGGGINILTDTDFKIGGKKVISNKGTGNIFVGENSGNAGITGGTNTFVGANSGQSTIAGTENVFIGGNAGASNTSGGFNLLLGSGAGYANTTGGFNAFIGAYAGSSNTTGAGNVFIGSNAGRSNTTGASNFCLGSSAGYANTTGDFNSFLGTNAGSSNTSGSGNVFLGSNAGFTNSSGGQNIFIGAAAGYANSVGTGNLFLGNSAGNTNTTGTDNTYIGKSAAGSAALTNATAIGANAAATASNTVVLGNLATTVVGKGLSTATESGLRLNIGSGSTPVTTGATNKVLSVNGAGDVILVQLSSAIVNSIGDSKASESNWKQEDGYLYNNSTNGVVINGTGLDGNSLIVKGGVLSKEVNVKVEGSESWPDYVFQPSYKRMSLEEVEKFITVNKHLPNVPSAAEMAITGNNLGNTDIKLLEKVEELTLYLLEMKKANDAQAAELKALKQQVSKLRKK